MSQPDHKCDMLQGPSPLIIYHRGPSLQQGALPAVFYFALSGEESLLLDPYNQPVNFLINNNVRIFSFTLPAHGAGFDKQQAMALWAQQIGSGENIIEEFIGHCLKNINYLIEEGLVNPYHLATSGLSRGGFMATHLAARDDRVNTVLGFAPLTDLIALNEFKEICHHQLVQDLSLMKLTRRLLHKKIRFYIGNRDMRVGTENCFVFIKEVADYTYLHGHRSPPVELIISSSIGHKGHGTSPAIFLDGAEWLNTQIHMSR